MGNRQNFGRIDVREFFSLLDGKIEKRKLQLIAAAMAESIAKDGVQRVIDSSEIPAPRLASLRKQLREGSPCLNSD